LQQCSFRVNQACQANIFTFITFIPTLHLYQLSHTKVKL
jgi:hypothetical protein